MEYYITVTQEELTKLRDGLGILERLGEGEDFLNNLFLYGLTTKDVVLMDAKEAIADDNDVDEATLQVGQVALAIPLSSDVLYYLLGSGYKVGKDSFAYLGGGEGVRSSSFIFGYGKPTVTCGDFSTMALAVSDSWLENFLSQYKSSEAAPSVTPAETQVNRSTEATNPSAPKKSSKTASQRVELAKVIDEWL